MGNQARFGSADLIAHFAGADFAKARAAWLQKARATKSPDKKKPRQKETAGPESGAGGLHDAAENDPTKRQALVTL